MSLLRHHQLLMRSSSQPSGSWNSTVANLPGLWAWYRLDELAGAGTAADSSSNGRDGTYTATGVRTTPGIFPGSTAYRSSLGGRVNLPTFPISDNPQFSIVAWIISDGVNSIQSIVSADGGPRRTWQFRLYNANLQFITFTSGGASQCNTPPLSELVGVPAMVAATYDHGGLVRRALYVNGAQVITDTAGTLDTTPTPAAPVAIGARNNAGEIEPWGGGIDEVIITTTALSAAQISALWDARND